ncbi:unnamed protein product [Candidula unifasciata]|uniref:BTB domain-containing protein n=1 Tax=Candidula unifasciata TaxID=100452 RepID=A0A8S4A023_9EUPU|nr:unnamed protein product [Candidula unifasciata]
MSSDLEQVLETSSPGYPRRLLENMTRLWKENAFCDVTLLIGRRRFQAHKNVLAACSPFFKAMFFSGMEEQSRSEIELHDISSDVFNIIISFMYTGLVRVDINTCQDLLSVADMLGVDDIVEICSEFLLEHMSPQNCVGIYVFADAHNLVSVKQQAELYLEKNFLQACKEEEFLQLDIDTLLPILASERLHIERESQVLEAGIEWITADLPLRRKYLLQILSHIRMNLISQRHLFQVIDSCADHGIKMTLTKYASPTATSKTLNPHGMYLPASNINTPIWPRQNAKKYIYVIGGYTRNRHTFMSNISTLDSVERFDIYTKKWQSFAGMYNARLIYVVGGLTELFTESDCVESYNPVTKEWCPLAKLKYPRAYHGLAAHDGYLYAVGGFNEFKGSLNSVEKYSIKDNTWTNVSPMQISRAGAGVALADSKIYVFGGRSQDVELAGSSRFNASITLDSVECYDPDKDVWCNLPSMAYERCETVAVVL